MKPRRPPIGRVGDSAGTTEFGIQGRGSRVCASSQPAPSCVIRRGASPIRVRRSGEDAAGFRLRSWRRASVRIYVGRSVRRLGSCPAPSRTSWSAESARVVVVGWLRGLGRAVLQGPRHRQGGCLGALRLFDEAGAASGWIARDWLWRQGRGTGGFLLFGSPQRCTSNGGAQSN